MAGWHIVQCLSQHFKANHYQSEVPPEGDKFSFGFCPEGDKFALIASEGSDILVYAAAGRLRHRNITGWQQLSCKGGLAKAQMLVISDGEAPMTF